MLNKRSWPQAFIIRKSRCRRAARPVGNNPPLAHWLPLCRRQCLALVARQMAVLQATLSAWLLAADALRGYLAVAMDIKLRCLPTYLPATSPPCPKRQILRNQPFKPFSRINPIYLSCCHDFFYEKSKKMLASHPLLA